MNRFARLVWAVLGGGIGAAVLLWNPPGQREAPARYEQQRVDLDWPVPPPSGPRAAGQSPGSPPLETYFPQLDSSDSGERDRIIQILTLRNAELLPLLTSAQADVALRALHAAALAGPLPASLEPALLGFLPQFQNRLAGFQAESPPDRRAVLELKRQFGDWMQAWRNCPHASAARPYVLTEFLALARRSDPSLFEPLAEMAASAEAQ